MQKEIQEIKKRLSKILDPKRYKHSLRVAKTAARLARRYGADVGKTQVAALLHDVSRYLDRGSYLAEAKKCGISAGEDEKRQPKLLHPLLSAKMARKKFGVKDKEILSAIASHTQGKEKMNLLEKIIYLADHMEPGRDHPEAQKIRKTAYHDLDRAVVESANSMLKHLIADDLVISPRTVKTRNFYLKKCSK